MRRLAPTPILVALTFVLSFGLVGCMFEPFDDSDEIGSVDKSVNAQATQRIATYLLAGAPAIQRQKETLAAGNGKVKMTVSILNAPDPEHTNDDPDARYHQNYYWVYVSYRNRDKLLKYDTYLVQKDLSEILWANPDKDVFDRVGK